MHSIEILLGLKSAQNNSAYGTAMENQANCNNSITDDIPANRIEGEVGEKRSKKKIREKNKEEGENDLRRERWTVST